MTINFILKDSTLQKLSNCTENAKFRVHTRKLWPRLLICVIIFSSNLGPIKPFQCIDSSLCLTNMPPNLIMCSIKKGTY